MWPQIPDTFEGMDSAALYALADAILAARQAVLPTLTTEGEAEYDEYTTKERRIRSLAADKRGAELAAAEEAERQAEAERRQQASDAGDGGAGDGGNGDGDGGTGGGTDDDPNGDGGSGGDGGAGGDGADPSLAGVGGRRVQTSMSSGAAPARQTAADRRAARWVSTGMADNGPAAGETFESNLQLAEAIRSMYEVVEAGSDKKHYLGRIYANYDEDHILDPDKPWTDLQSRFDRTDEEIEAAFCPPPTPIYDLACENETRRPVMTGLPGYRSPDRGAFTVLASPTLSDISSTAYGQWTSSDDSDENAIKGPCQTIECVDPSTFEIYAIYRCLTVKNFMQMTFPELVAAYLNRLQAAAARYAEILLLEAMSTASTAISAPALGYNGATTLQSTILNYLALYQEQERWDTQTMDVWFPRWVLWAIKTDMLRRRRTDGGVNRVPSDGDVQALFTDAGVTAHWFMDQPSWAATVPAVATGGVLNLYPSNVDFLIHKRGKFALMERGMVSVGVTGNNMYRQQDDLLRNQFTFFFEGAEGLIDTDSCPAHKVRVPACWNGVQIADDVIDCEGNNYAGVDSGGA